MKIIELTKGKAAIVDDRDFKRLAQHRWVFSETKNGGYAVRRVMRNRKTTTILMHREIINARKGVEVDHRDGNTLNNRRLNLRTATHSQNLWNAKIRSDNTTGLKGVVERKDRKKTPFMARITKHGKTHYLGVFSTALEAHSAYARAATEMFGDFARLN